VYDIGNPLLAGAYMELIAAGYHTIQHFLASVSFTQPAALPLYASNGLASAVPILK
jgi:hypothetical protein